MPILFIFLILENIIERFIPILKFYDEFMTIVALIIIIFSLPRIKFTHNQIGILMGLVVTICLGIFGHMFSGVIISKIAVFKDILALSKFFVIYLFGSVVLKKGISEKDLGSVIFFSKFYLVVLLFFGVVSQFINLNMTYEYRYFIKSYAFLYTHETFLVSSVVAMLAVLILQNKKGNLLFILIGFFVLALSMRSKAIIFMMIVSGLTWFWKDGTTKNGEKRFNKKNLLLLLSGILLITFLILKNKLMLYVGFGMTAARPALYMVSFEIVKRFFPFGTGLGTFARNV